MKTSNFTSKDIARFWTKVGITAIPDKCWEWQAAKDNRGYGRFCLSTSIRSCLSHRVAFLLTHGDIPDGLYVCHNCPGGDNTSCCNPSHLFLGTHRDNMKDMMNKGRGKTPRLEGEQHPRHKLVANQVLYIRERFAAGDISKTELARQMSVDDSTISDIVFAKSWRSVK